MRFLFFKYQCQKITDSERLINSETTFWSGQVAIGHYRHFGTRINAAAESPNRCRRLQACYYTVGELVTPVFGSLARTSRFWHSVIPAPVLRQEPGRCAAQISIAPPTPHESLSAQRKHGLFRWLRFPEAQQFFVSFFLTLPEQQVFSRQGFVT